MYELSKNISLLLVTTVAFILYFEDVIMSPVDDKSLGAFTMFMFAVASIGIGYDMMNAGYVFLSAILCGLYTIYRVRDFEIALK